jgi:hypothetical protein
MNSFSWYSSFATSLENVGVQPVGVPKMAAALAVAVLVAMLTHALYRYASSIKKYLRKIQESTLFGGQTTAPKNKKDPFRMIRRRRYDTVSVNGNGNGRDGGRENSYSSSTICSQLASLVEILPECKLKNITNNNDDDDEHLSHHLHRLDSLGSYLASLNPAIGPERLPVFMENELQAALGAALLRAIGPQFGAALLPGLVGHNAVQSAIATIVQAFSNTFLLQSSSNTETTSTTARTTSDTSSRRGSSLRGSIANVTNTPTKMSENSRQEHDHHHRLQGAPVSIFALSYLAEINYNVTATARNRNPTLPKSPPDSRHEKASATSSPTPLDRLYLGEVGFEPSFSTAAAPPNKSNSSSSSNSRSKSKPKENDNTNEPDDTDTGTGTTTTIDDELLLLRNPFYLSRDWDRVLRGMEDLLVRQQSTGTTSAKDDDEATTRDGSSPVSSGEKRAGAVTDDANTGNHKRFDPHSKQMPPPVPIDDRLLPDLHLGWGGDVMCTHSQREILQNRLLSCLLNRLAFNYYHTSTMKNQKCHSAHSSLPQRPKSDNNDRYKEQDKVFCIVLDQRDGGGDDNDDQQHGHKQIIITKPSELIQALMDMGHSVEACITTHPTSFGVALCVKEMDDSWTQLPLAYMLQTGCTNESNDDPSSTTRCLEAVCALPHSGLNLEIYNGPLLFQSPSSSKGDGRMSIQHFMGVESFCGWQSNHNADVSWLRDVVCGKRLQFRPPRSGDKNSDRNRQDILTAVTIAALQAVTINVVGTEQNLPLGGYGLTGVCNDSAAWLEQAIFGSTHIYPITMNGRFARMLLRRAVAIRDSMSNGNNSDYDTTALEPKLVQHHDDVKAVNQLIRALLELKSDMNSLPSQVLDQCRRQLHCIHPETPFALLRQSQAILESIQEEFKSHYHI